MRYVIELELPDNDFVLSQIKYTGVSWGVWGYSGCAKAKPKTADHWIPVEEQLPETFKPVIVCRKGKDGSDRVEQGMLDVNGWWKVYGTRTKAVKHWMPLPKPPEWEGTARNGR